MKVGFIGLGLMGFRMAKRLIEQGHDLVLWNRTIEKAQRLGKNVANSPAELAKQSDFVMLMLSDEDACDSVIFGKDGIVNGIEENKEYIIVNFSTVSPIYGIKTKEKLEQYNISYVEAPVWGSLKEAENGELITLLAGSENAIGKVKPAIEVLSKEIIYMGEVGKASAMKLVINGFSLTTVALFSEVISLAKGWEIDLNKVYDILRKTWMKAIVDKYGQRILNDEVPQRFKVELAKKDVFYALKSGYAKNIPMNVIAGAVKTYVGATKFRKEAIDYTRNVFRYYLKFIE
ncbi:MAG: NAD(P)-dependent oxidoreductase [Candidatus Asgardarchaeia archaeon]